MLHAQVYYRAVAPQHVKPKDALELLQCPNEMKGLFKTSHSRSGYIPAAHGAHECARARDPVFRRVGAQLPAPSRYINTHFPRSAAAAD